jgi:hypothetical protein
LSLEGDPIVRLPVDEEIGNRADRRDAGQGPEALHRVGEERRSPGLIVVRRAARELRPHVGRHVLEFPALRLPVAEVQERGSVRQVLLDVARPQDGEPVRILIRQVAQDDRLEHAENCGVRSYAERERQHGDQRESRGLEQGAQTVAQVLGEAVHLGASW